MVESFSNGRCSLGGDSTLGVEPGSQVVEVSGASDVAIGSPRADVPRVAISQVGACKVTTLRTHDGVAE